MFKLPPKAYQDQFANLFKVPYHRFHNATGFDIIGFDEWLGAGDESVKDNVTRRFGNAAVELLLRIMQNEINAI